jgi:tellurite resistance protein TerA
VLPPDPIAPPLAAPPLPLTPPEPVVPPSLPPAPPLALPPLPEVSPVPPLEHAPSVSDATATKINWTFFIAVLLWLARSRVHKTLGVG